MRTVESTGQFKRNTKLLAKRGWNLHLLDSLVIKLASDVDPRTLFKNHPLKGEWRGHEECHVTSVADDWLLVYRKVGATRLILAATGDHQMIFGE